MITSTRSFPLMLWCVAVFIASACDQLASTAEPSGETLSSRSVISVRATPSDPVAAGPEALVSFQALLPRGATSRTVTFTTSAGFFVENAGKQITARAVLDDADTTKLLAQAALRDTIAETAIVRAAVGEFYDTVSVRFVKLP